MYNKQLNLIGQLQIIEISFFFFKNMSHQSFKRRAYDISQTALYMVQRGINRVATVVLLMSVIMAIGVPSIDFRFSI